MTAVVVLENDEPVGIMGVSRASVMHLFSEFRPELSDRLRSITVLRAIKAAQGILERCRTTVYAVADHSEGARMLKRLGFVERDGVFQWRASA